MSSSTSMRLSSRSFSYWFCLVVQITFVTSAMTFLLCISLCQPHVVEACHSVRRLRRAAHCGFSRKPKGFVALCATGVGCS